MATVTAIVAVAATAVTVTIERSARPVGTRSRAVAWLAGVLLLGLTACGSSGGGVAASNSERVPASTEVVAVTAPVVVPATPASVAAPAIPETAPAAPAPPAIDGAAALGGALDLMAFGYHFSTTVAVDGNPVVTAEGDHLTDGTRLTLTGPAGALSYVITPGGSWVLPENGEWATLADAPTSADPLAALRAPASVVVDTYDGTTAALTVTVPAVALGIAGDPATMANVQVRLDGSTLTQVSYSTAVDGHPAAVSAAIGPVVDATPVVPPV